MADTTDIQEIKSRLDIVSVVGRYVKLKKAGRTYTGLCPFHNEKTPSFHVNQTMEMYKCFGCGEAGDVIRFVQKVEHIEFPQALEKLAAEAGVVLKKSDDPLLRKIGVIRAMNVLAQDFFHFVLTSHESGKGALQYAKQTRKFSDKQISEYRIGYAPEGRDVLQRFLQKKGYTIQQIREAGFINEKGNDKYTDRLMFPILDASGKVVGFSGRTIKKGDIRPKYLNSAESEVYKKRFLLFGLHLAKAAIEEKDMAIMTEGQIDVIMSQQFGVANIVAPLGTGLTDTQLQLLSRHTKNVAFCFNNDAAGEKSLYRSVGIALQQGMHPFLVSLPSDVKDIDELLQKRPDEWKDRANNPKDFFEVKLIALKPRIKKDPVLFEKELQVLLDSLSLADELKQGIVAKQIAEILLLSEQGVLDRIQKKPNQGKNLQEQIKVTRGVMNTTEYVLSMIATLPLLTSVLGTPAEVDTYFQEEMHRKVYEKLYAFAKKYFSFVESVTDRETGKLQTTWDQIAARFTNECSLEFSKYISKISEDAEIGALLEKILFSELTSTLTITNDVVDDFFKTWTRLKKQSITLQLEKLRGELSRAEQLGQDKIVQELEQKTSALLIELRKVQ